GSACRPGRSRQPETSRRGTLLLSKPNGEAAGEARRMPSKPSLEPPSEPFAWSEFWQAVATTLPAIAAAVPFAFLLGALATEKGFSVLEAGLLAALLFAGSAQLTGPGS